MDPDPSLTTISLILQQGTDRLKPKHQTCITVSKGLYTLLSTTKTEHIYTCQNVPSHEYDPSVRSPQQIARSGSLCSSLTLQSIYNTV